jgi:hypothetical protein
MRYLVRAKVKPERAADLFAAIQTDTLGQGSVAEGEYLRNMHEARLFPDGTARWVETCYCATPLEEELPYWEEFFELTKIQDAHSRRNCRDENGSEPWACGNCDCTRKLEQRLAKTGVPFLPELAKTTSPAAATQPANFTAPAQLDRETAEPQGRQIGANLETSYNPNRKVGLQTMFE